MKIQNEMKYNLRTVPFGDIKSGHTFIYQNMTCIKLRNGDSAVECETGMYIIMPSSKETHVLPVDCVFVVHDVDVKEQRRVESDVDPEGYTKCHVCSNCYVKQ